MGTFTQRRVVSSRPSSIRPGRSSSRIGRSVTVPSLSGGSGGSTWSGRRGIQDVLGRGRGWAEQAAAAADAEAERGRRHAQSARDQEGRLVRPEPGAAGAGAPGGEGGAELVAGEHP